ncbi:MAG: hypothetical protein ACFBSG_20075 [Leptolyngbyaceae cyanobacterium]
MARSLEQINTELAKLSAATEEIDQELKDLYGEYLDVLSKAVKRQLILAAYHLCTQAYPDEFLTLKVTAREQLQKQLRQAASQGAEQIKQLGTVTNLSALTSRLEAAIESAAQVESEGSAAADNFKDVVDESANLSASEDAALRKAGVEDEDEASQQEMATADDSETADSSEVASAMLKRLSTSLSIFSILGAEPNTPVSLAKRHVLLERHLRAILRMLSGLVNQLLKRVDILPDLPEMVIAAAADEGESAGPSMPNLLNVLVEIGDRPEDDDDDDDSEDADPLEDDIVEREMTHLVAVNLRLADIEFADPHAALWRGRLQETLHKLKQLGRRYQKLQQEKARAEAEHAWRAIWFED